MEAEKNYPVDFKTKVLDKINDIDEDVAEFFRAENPSFFFYFRHFTAKRRLNTCGQLGTAPS